MRVRLQARHRRPLPGCECVVTREGKPMEKRATGSIDEISPSLLLSRSSPSLSHTRTHTFSLSLSPTFLTVLSFCVRATAVGLTVSLPSIN